MNEPLKIDFFSGGQIYMGRKLSVFSGLLVLEGAYHWALEVFFSRFLSDDVTIYNMESARIFGAGMKLTMGP